MDEFNTSSDLTDILSRRSINIDQSYASTADLYKQAQEARIKGEAVYTVESPYSDPQQMINDKIQNLLTSMAIGDEKSMYEGAVNNSYGTNLWNILSSLG